MTATYFLYFGLLFVEVVLGLLEVRSGKKLSFYGILLLVVYSLFAGLKYSLGDDFQGYLLHYENIYYGNEIDSHFEEGYKVLCRIMASFKVPPAFFFVFLNFINISGICFISKKTIPQALPWVVAIFIMFDAGLSLSTNVYRQYLAMSSLCFILPLVLRTKFRLLFVGCCFLLSSFHSSALLSLLYLVLPDKNIVTEKNKFTYILIAGCLYVMGSTLMPYVLKGMTSIASLIGYGDRAREYDGRYQVELGSGMGVLIKYFQMSLIVWYYPRLKKIYPSNRMLTLCFNGYFIGYIIRPLLFTDIVLLRTIYYYSIFEYLLIGIVIFYLINKSRPRNSGAFIGIMIVLLYVLLFASYISTSINWMSPYIPFTNLFG